MSGATKNYLAVDLGAESGRVMLGRLGERGLTLEEVHRFPNGPVKQDGALHWDFEALMEAILTGLGKGLAQAPEVASIGVDTWGVDYGLVDKEGRLLENPYHYRDPRTQGVIKRALETVPKERIYELTGIQFMPINTLYQLLETKWNRPELLERAAQLVFMPNLVMQRLTGVISAEYTIASTSQMMDMRTGQWSRELLEAFGLPAAILPEPMAPGQTVGPLTEAVRERLGCGPVPVVTVGTHDTASAVAGVPAGHGRPWSYLSSGTWSLPGVETREPVIQHESMDLTNEGGIEGTIRLLQNVTGLWLLQECRRQWAEEGKGYEYSELAQMAEGAEPFQVVINTSDDVFLTPGDMPGKIARQLEAHGERMPEGHGGLTRAILENLALRYEQTLARIETATGQTAEVVHIVGGGIKNRLLNQLTANATGKQVITGPVEATVTGNVLVQAMATGQVGSLSEARALVAGSFAEEGGTYEPTEQEAWGAFRERAKQILTT